MTAPLRVLFALPGLHAVNRGAEVVFELVASHLARDPAYRVTLVGSGRPRPNDPYEFRHARCTPRERFRRFPRIPPLRSEYVWEELSFAPRLWRAYDPREFDVTATCSFPFVHWVLRAKGGAHRPPHVYITQNGDWAPRRLNSEYKKFSCDGLLCTNPEYFERHKDTWRCALIPNGVDTITHAPGPSERPRFEIPEGRPVVLVVAALIPSKRVADAIRAAAATDAYLFVAGDGPLAPQIDALLAELAPDRHQRRPIPRENMPALYRSADLLLHMSKEEPFGNIYIEALATGLPIVAHDTPGTRWITEDSAVLLDTDRLPEVTHAIRRTLDTPDPAAAARRRLIAERRFAWPVVARQYGTFLREAAESRRERSTPHDARPA